MARGLSSCVRDGRAGTGPGDALVVGDEQGRFVPLSERQRGIADELYVNGWSRISVTPPPRFFGLSNARAGADALALAVVCQVVFGDDQAEVLDAAAARMEQYHQNKPIAKHVGRSLARIANDAIADLDRSEDPRLAQQHLQRADELLKQFLCEDHAYRSRLTLHGYEQRLSRFGNQITATVADPMPESIRRCEELQAEIAAHRRAKIGQRVEQISRTEMALRLLRWLAAPAPSGNVFFRDRQVYRKELAFVDWARESVCRGEDVADSDAKRTSNSIKPF